jgi:hypothetical protein
MTRGQKLNIKIMKNLLKKINVFGLAVVLVCGVIFTTQSAFTSVDPLEDGWYEIFITNTDFPEDEANQQIVGTTPLSVAPPLEDEEGCAQTINTGFKCAVFLDFDGVVEEMPATVDDVDGDAVQLIDDARQPL